MRSSKFSGPRTWFQAVKAIFSPARKKPYRRRPQIEELESRIAPAIFNVATEAQLRSAIDSANTNNQAVNTINLTADINLATNNSAGQENADQEGDLDIDNLNGSVSAK